MRLDLLLIVASFFVVTLISVPLGAPNTAHAATYGVIAFAATTVGVIVKRP